MPTDPQFLAPDGAVSSGCPGPAPPDGICRNAVSLCGSLAEPAEERQLAGGVQVVRWTLRIPRGPDRAGSDLIDCVAVDCQLQQQAVQWPPGMTLVVAGALRRRFFRTGGRTTTRVEVEAHQVTELALPPAPGPDHDGAVQRS
jgi:single-strand DNA-binding protein